MKPRPGCEPPQPSARARSLPVPSGRIATGGVYSNPAVSSRDSTQPTVPSPPHTSTRKRPTERKHWSACSAWPWLRSITCCGESSARSCTSVASPCRPPLALLMNTSSGVRSLAASVCGRKVHECSHAAGAPRLSGERSEIRLLTVSDIRCSVVVAGCEEARSRSLLSPKSRASGGRMRRQMRARSESRGATVQSSSS